MNDQLSTGTTLEILAPYLPYNVEVEVTANPGNWFGGRGLLFRLGWPYNEKLHPMAIVSLAQNKAAPVPLSHILPVLRPFSQLCDPLPDGTVPAVEVAKLIWPEEAGETAWDTVKASFGNESIINVMEGDWTLLSIQSDFDIDVDGSAHTNQAAVVDYLRGKHFALPVNGRPLIEGVDYIAKAAATPTTEEETRPG